MRFRRLTSVVTLLGCLVSATALAQAVNVTSGSINGRVADSSGGVLPGVSVTATNADTGLKRTVVSETDGAYVISLLPPGRYRVAAELEGLGKASVSNVNVLLGSSARLDIKVTPQVSESVTVTATADTLRTGAASSVTNDQIESLPILGRDFRSLASLTPGVVDAFGGRITANGARGIATDYNIDGASSNNDFFGENTGGTRAPFTFSQAAIREFQVVRSQYDAEFGRGVGAQLNAITKSGTNELHGEGFFFRRNRDWASPRPAYLGTCPNGTASAGTGDCRLIVDSFRAKDSTQGGFAVGGPLVRNKAFFFGNFDSQRQKLPIGITDIRNVTGFTSLTPTVQQQFLTKVESLVGRPYGDELAYNQTFDQNTYLGKVDVEINASTRLSIRDNYTNFENGNNQTLGNLSNQGVENDKFNQLVGQLTKVLGNRMVNETLVEFGIDQRPVTPNSTSPEIQVSGITSGTIFFGQNDFLPSNTKERKVQLKNTLRYILGNHSFKVGSEALLVHIDNLFPRNLSGVFIYNNPTNFVNDVPNTFRQGYGAGGGLTSWDQDTFAFYAADNFRVNPRLTLDYGVRYDWQTMPGPATNVFPQHPEFITNIHVDRNNVAPRFGVAYDVDGRGHSVLRGGVGRFFGYMPAILLSNPLTQISGNFLQGSITCTATGLAVPCPTYPNTLTPDQFARLGSTAGTDIVTIGPQYQAQEAWRSNVQYERQFPHGYSAAVGVIYSKMTKVQGSRNINAVPSGITLAGLPVYDLGTAAPTRLYTDMGVVRELCSCETASYRSFTLETRRLVASRWMPSWDASYTLARSIDQDSNERSTSSSFLFDPLNPTLSEGPSDNDVRHRFIANATYKLPYGVQLSAILQVRSGLPYNGGIAFTGVGIPGSPSSLNGLSQTTGNIPVFVNASGSIIDLTQANGLTRAQFSSFLNAQGAQLVGRNAFRQPNWHTFDMRVTKSFDISAGSRRMQVQLIGEGFNLLNTRNETVGSTNQNRFRATYTQATGTYQFTDFANPTGFGRTNGYAGTPDPRQAQVALKFIF